MVLSAMYARGQRAMLVAAWAISSLIAGTSAQAKDEVPSFAARCVETQTRMITTNAEVHKGKMQEMRSFAPQFDSPAGIMAIERFIYRQGDDHVDRERSDTSPKIVARTKDTLVISDVDFANTAASGARVFVINTRLKQAVAARVFGYDTSGGGLGAATVEMTCEFSDPPALTRPQP